MCVVAGRDRVGTEFGVFSDRLTREEKSEPPVETVWEVQVLSDLKDRIPTRIDKDMDLLGRNGSVEYRGGSEVSRESG